MRCRNIPASRASGSNKSKRLSLTGTVKTWTSLTRRKSSSTRSVIQVLARCSKDSLSSSMTNMEPRSQVPLGSTNRLSKLEIWRIKRTFKTELTVSTKMWEGLMSLTLQLTRRIRQRCSGHPLQRIVIRAVLLARKTLPSFPKCVGKVRSSAATLRQSFSRIIRFTKPRALSIANRAVLSLT